MSSSFPKTQLSKLSTKNKGFMLASFYLNRTDNQYKKIKVNSGLVKIRFDTRDFDGTVKIAVSVKPGSDLHEWLAGIDAMTLKLMELNAGSIFDKLMTLDELKAFHRPLLDARKSRTPVFRVKVDPEDVLKYGSSTKIKKKKTRIVLMPEEKEAEWTNLTEGKRVQMLIEPVYGNVLRKDKTFGFTFCARCIKVFSQEESESEEEEEDEETSDDEDFWGPSKKKQKLDSK